MIKLLHFADAHIDLARQGRRDAESGLPLRVLDFLHALDTIIEAAIRERVDLVIFAGDAYRDRSPQPTYQREWDKRMTRLSAAGIQTILVAGNHDLSPAVGRAHTFQEFETLKVSNVHVISRPCLLGPEELNGLPVQIIAIPWLNRSGLAATLEMEEDVSGSFTALMEEKLTEIIESYLAKLDGNMPAILASHVSVQGASYGNERSVMLGRDYVLPTSLTRDERLDYVALGHIHKAQDLNAGGHHPVIYPGSIERVDFGEINDRKTYVIAQVERNNTSYIQFDLAGRKFIDCFIEITSTENVNERILAALPKADELKDAILRLTVAYPRDWEAMIDEPSIRRAAEGAFEFHFVRRPRTQVRIRLSADESIAHLPPLVLLKKYWQAVPPSVENTEELTALASDIIHAVEIGFLPEEENLAA